mgnify:CR=1 FL=1
MSISTEELRLLQNTPLFGNMNETSIHMVVGNQMPRSYPKKALLFQEGDYANRFYIMLDGWVKLYRCTPEGQEAVISTYTRGEIFAECAMFMGASFPVSAETICASRLLTIEATTMRRAINENPDLAFSIMASASRHLKTLVDQLEQMKLDTGPERVAKFLLELSYSTDEDQGVNLPYEKSLIAAKLGMKPESFSRALAKLREVGVQINGDQVSISDVVALASFAKKDYLGPIVTPCSDTGIQKYI